MFTLLFLLIANAVNWNMQAQRLRREADEMSIELSENQRQVNGFETRKLTYARAEEAFLKHKAQYQAAIPKFQAIMDRYGKLEVEDPSKLYLVDVPTLGIEDFLVKQIRMWVPDEKYRLTVGFQSSGLPGSSSAVSSFGESKIFVPSGKKTFDLPEGESLIRFEWHELKERRALQGRVYLNGSMIHEFGLNGEPGGGYSSSSMILTKSKAFRVRKQRTLFSITPSLESGVGEKIGLILVHDQEQP